MSTLGLIDTAFLRMESPRTPMHIGGLLTFRLPANARPEVLPSLLARLRRYPLMPPPIDGVVIGWSIRHPLPCWQPAPFDPEYHVRHSALPRPGGERELGELVARLHSHPLDLRHPPWECHLIEGLCNGRFALYFKVHHCAADGVTAMHLVRRWLSDSADADSDPLAEAPCSRNLPTTGGLMSQLRRSIDEVRAQWHGAPLLARALWRMSQAGRGSGIRAVIETPRSTLNVPITQHRRLGTQRLPLERVRAIAAATDTSVNDVLVALCGGALRRYLDEQQALPRDTLLASIPVGLSRAAGTAGNAVAGFVCPLGTRTADPLQRLQEIHRVTTLAKDVLKTLTPAAAQQLTLMGLSPLLLGQITGTLPWLPPLFNVTISSVVVSKSPLYFYGAELEAMYPMSILFDGYALNITLVGYHDHVAVGFTGCRDAVLHLQRLAVYVGEELPVLEVAAGVGKTPSRRRR